MNQKTSEKIFQDAITWLVTEHNYLQTVKEDISKVQLIILAIKKLGKASNATDPDDAFAKAHDAYTRATKHFKYTARAEARFNTLETDISQALAELEKRVSAEFSGTDPELSKLRQRISTEAKSILLATSLYESQIWIELGRVGNAIFRDSKTLISAGVDPLPHNLEMIQECLVSITQALTWMEALTVDLQEAERIFKQFSQRTDVLLPAPKIYDLLMSKGKYAQLDPAKRMGIWNNWVATTKTKKNLSALNLRGASLMGFNFGDFTLNDTDFSSASLTQAKFDRAELSSALFLNVTAVRASFVGADLNSANFARANLQKSNFDGANLIFANLRHADFRAASFLNTQLDYADIKDADFAGAKLRLEQLQNAKNLKHAKNLPPGLN